jgi:hypothetical protein
MIIITPYYIKNFASRAQREGRGLHTWLRSVMNCWVGSVVGGADGQGRGPLKPTSQLQAEPSFKKQRASQF